MKSLLSVDRELGQLLGRAAGRGDSGIITGVRGKLKRLFCLDGGALALAVSNVIEEQLAYKLLRVGLLRHGDLKAAQDACARQKALKLSCFLVEHGAISAEEMTRVVEEHVRELLFATLDWSDGNCTFEHGKPDLSGEFTVRANGVGLLLEYARSHPASLDATRMRIGPPNIQPVRAPEAEKLLEGITLDPQALFVLGHCDGKRLLGQLVAESPHAAEPTWRAIYGLVLAGAVEPRGARRHEVSDDGTVSRDELIARLDRAAEANHYGVLELSPTAKHDEIRETYYFLARRYHPDRFRAGSMQDLLGRIEAYFAQVTEAYNTLSDPQRRQSYDEDFAAVAAPKKPEQDTRELARQNYVLARTLIERGRFTDAVTSLENAIKLDDTQAKFYLELGRLLARNPRHRQAAEKNLIRCNEIDPAMAEGYYALGELYARTNREEDAARLFREVLRWEPGHLGAAEKLAELGESPSGEGGGLRGLFRG